MARKGRIIVVAGTNASGKSALGVELAVRYGGEIVSADSRQVFRGLDLGSGKITRGEMRGVPHHLIDVCEPDAYFSMGEFQRLAYTAIDGALARGRLPFLVGGTGLYINSVADGYVLSQVRPDLEYRRELEKLDTPALYSRLTRLSPDAGIDPNNRNRVMRALERLHDGDSRSDVKQPRYEALKLGVTWPREALCARIDERLRIRVAQGMIDEVRGLLDAGVRPEFLRGLGLEYRLIAQHLLGEIADREAMLSELSRAIKRFARRQMTWFRRDPDILWLDMAENPVGQACAAIDAFLGRG